MNDMNVSLPDALQEYVEEQVTSGDYETSSEFLREPVCQDKQLKTLERLESLLLEGLESGDPIAVTPDLWKELWGRVDERKERSKA